MTASLAILLVESCICVSAEDAQRTKFRARVDMVLLTFTVTDSKGNYVTELSPKDFTVREDGIEQKIATFAEGSEAIRVFDSSMKPADGKAVFVLFDTSNAMYSTFPYASDAIADFVRNMEPGNAVAVYSFSRNLTRVAPLTANLTEAISGLRKVVAGAETAVYNSLLLTLRDAAKVAGRKAIVLFSNGPDNASIVAPDDVRAVAEDEGIPIYVVATEKASRDLISTRVFERLASGTGGRVYSAKTWAKQLIAFDSIRNDLVHSYTISYYPRPNPNRGYRKIQIEVVSDAGKRYRLRARAGYRPHLPDENGESAATSRVSAESGNAVGGHEQAAEDPKP